MEEHYVKVADDGSGSNVATVDCVVDAWDGSARVMQRMCVTPDSYGDTYSLYFGGSTPDGLDVGMGDDPPLSRAIDVRGKSRLTIISRVSASGGSFKVIPLIYPGTLGDTTGTEEPVGSLDEKEAIGTAVTTALGGYVASTLTWDVSGFYYVIPLFVEISSSNSVYAYALVI